MKKYDAIIIGSGQGGTPLARKLAINGYKTALIERRWVGGTCINDGCTPTKAMVASAKAAYDLKRAHELGINVQNFSVSMEDVIRRQHDIVYSFRKSSEEKLLGTDNLDLIFGEASFIGKKKIRVTEAGGVSYEMEAGLIFIDTGTRPHVPPVDGLNTIDYLTSTSILQLKKLPEHLLIVGSGYIAIEFGQMYRRFGSRVTLLERSQRILSREDEDVANEVSRILTEEGIAIKLESEVVRFSKGNDHVSVTIQTPGGPENILCSHVLLAAGRAPNTEILNPGISGIVLDDRGYITVDDYLNTSVEGIYAIGDVKGGPAFTHISYHDYIVLSANIIDGRKISTKDRLIPYCMYMDPQLGRVGITEQEATKQGLDIRVAKMPMSHVARAIETGDTRGFMKAIVDKSSKKILGAAILGPEGGEIMSMLEMAMMGNITYDKIRDAVFAHPTYAEALNNLFATIEN